MNTSISHLSISELLAPEGFPCACGKTHKAGGVRFVKTGRGAIAALPEAMKAIGVSRPMLVCDLNTYEAAGSKVEEVLNASGITFSKYCFPTHAHLKPAEWELGSISMHFDENCDVIIAIGGGVMNDLCKLLGRCANRPTMIVGTAPSMDGYASNSGSMEVNNVKVTIYTPSPAAILCDTEVLSRAPERMMLSGIGDMMAKYIAICEWRISHLITGEYYCEEVAQMMRTAVDTVQASMEKVMERDPDAAGKVTDGLILAGLGMALAGVSRPASGLEHAFSHVWEMMALDQHQEYDFHGIQVGIGTVLTFHIYDRIRHLKPTAEAIEKAIASWDEAAWEKKVADVFGDTAPELIEKAHASGRNDQNRRRERGLFIIKHWDEIQQIIEEELPDFEPLLARFKAIRLPIHPREIGRTNQEAVDAFTGSRDMRDRYMTSSMLWDLGLLDDFAADLADYLEQH